VFVQLVSGGYINSFQVVHFEVAGSGTNWAIVAYVNRAEYVDTYVLATPYSSEAAAQTGLANLVTTPNVQQVSVSGPVTVQLPTLTTTSS
jgi:hypothetical protein